MMLADGPAVFISRAAAGRIPVKAIRIVSAVSMAALGVWTIVSG
jgi:putative Ca2+/H+ antiporter (TMEM165/GDT1 family)